ncbi:hypothetical protein CkaCkLH20_11111 [Colletotrichum karsti]|uniref:NAD-dependent epimerase/dehydratase domain-containing protein n=1 Tax=Colletotrichum karsti TaxID=1095194 RepID=A0A9P6HW44_9PEZI|nr:uncharacterized protein CkaCkLH20_11111 [Colletotrichum karsti]KAF9871464.1 hypothetical protein CkaCkLH20_11111 [Colletotrichum karsti]
MSQNILIVGASGYIGGTVLNSLLSSGVLPTANIRGAVRSDAQADELRNLGIQAVKITLTDHDAVARAVLDNHIDIVLHTASSMDFSLAEPLLHALKKRKDATSGVTAFADKAGWTHGLVKESDDIYDLQRQAAESYVVRETDTAVARVGEELGVFAYIVVPPLVYGNGTGTGNTQSVQIPILIRAAAAHKQVYQFSEDAVMFNLYPSHQITKLTGEQTWPAVHVIDLANYYVSLIRRIVQQGPLASGKKGYYLVRSHDVTFHEIAEALGKELYQRKLVDSPHPATWPSDEVAVKALGLPLYYTRLAWSSTALVQSERHKDLGWHPEWNHDRFLAEIGESIDPALQAETVAGSLASLSTS